MNMQEQAGVEKLACLKTNEHTGRRAAATARNIFMLVRDLARGR
jgi:hypothetical protein